MGFLLCKFYKNFLTFFNKSIDNYYTTLYNISVVRNTTKLNKQMKLNCKTFLRLTNKIILYTKEVFKIPKLIAQTEYRADGKKAIKSYRITLQKTEIENTCKLQQGDELEIEYKKNKIIITKKEN